MKKKEEKDRAILTAAENEFFLHGVDAATMDNIAVQSGVSKATLYKYYPAKIDLLKEMANQMYAQIGREKPCSYAPDRSLESMIAEIIDGKFRLMTNNKFIRIVKILSIHQIKKTELDVPATKRFYEERQTFIRWAAHCQEDGKLTRDYQAEEISEWFHALFDGMILWPLVFGLKDHLTKKSILQYKETLILSFLKTFASP